jgi:hypothetical protein
MTGGRDLAALDLSDAPSGAPPSPHGSVEVGHCEPLPATVESTPVADTFRILWLLLSAIR